MGIYVHLQDIVWYIALAGMGLVALGFILVISQAGKTVDADAAARSGRHSSQFKAWLFGILVLIFIVGTWDTLRRYPIPDQGGPFDDPQVVDVAGYQWVWIIKPTTIRTNLATEFRVTSGDVNHGFAIYAPDGRIVAQTQAMPGYTNKLEHTFTQPGTYTIQCLEFCGIGHAPMTSTIQVVANQ
jgi:cytochrome c oxidase subunit 2